MVDSKSTDKLKLMLDFIKSSIKSSSEVLPTNNIQSLELTWKELASSSTPLPFVKVTFK